MSAILLIGNQKGGTGKTTTAVTLSHGLALAGYRVLLVDLDSQGNVADSLGLESGNDLSTVLTPYTNTALTKIPIEQAVTSSGRQNLDVIRSDKYTYEAKLGLSSAMFREQVLAKLLATSDYDVIVLDAAPSVDLLLTNALVCATYLLIPSQLEQLSMKGLSDMLQSLMYLKEEGGTNCQLAGIIPTFYERVTKETYAQLNHLATAFKKAVLPPIPKDNQCRVATRHGQTLWEFDPNTRALQGYQDKKGNYIGGYVQVLDRLKELL